MFSAFQDSPAPMWVAAVALIDARGRVLVQKRPAGGEHGALWEFPGGKLEAGEAPEKTAVRELFEELGITIALPDLRPVSFACGLVSARERPRSLVILLFACAVWQGEPQAHAATDLAWCELSALATLPMPPLDYPLAEALTRLITSNAN